MKMRMRQAGVPLMGVLAVALLLTGCSSRMKPPVHTMTDSECMSIADTLKTLRMGDALPRVVQVMGQPDKSYRVIAPFGSTYDVIEYNVGQTPCARMVLNAPKKLTLIFDSKGGLEGYGKNKFRRLQAATMVRVNGLPIDARQFDAE